MSEKRRFMEYSDFSYFDLCNKAELTNDSNLSTEENKQRQVDHAPEASLDAQIKNQERSSKNM